MRIVQMYEPPDGGVAEHVRQLGCSLLSRGHEVTIVGPPRSTAYAALEEAGATIHRLDLTGTIFAPALDLPAARALHSLLAAGGFDVGHAHGVKAGLLLRLVGAARLPVLYTPHCFAFISNEYRRDLSHPRLRRFSVVNAERALGLLTARLVCVAEFERAYADRLHIAKRDRRRVVHSGVSIDRGAAPDPALLEWRGEGRLLGAVSALRWEKGLHHLVEAAALLGSRAPGSRLAIVGEGAERDALQQLIGRRGAGDRIRLFDYGGRPEPHLLALDGFVLPSDSFEAMPIGLLEAMAAGLPVVASAVGGVPEAVADGRSGILVPPGDPPALAAALERLGEDAELGTAMGARGREIAERRFSLTGMVDSIEELYAEVSGEDG
ncbi:MAG: glycosyltransferase [Solirubrobacterales bacterium]